jgi:hypothetical protein
MNAGVDKMDHSKQLGKIVQHLSEDKPEEVAHLINSGSAQVNELVDIAPIIKSSQLSKVSEKMNTNVWDIDSIVHLAPFLQTEALDEIVIEAAKKAIN